MRQHDARRAPLNVAQGELADVLLALGLEVVPLGDAELGGGVGGEPPFLADAHPVAGRVELAEGGEELIREIANGFDVIDVRDEPSATLLGLDKVTRTGDDAYLGIGPEFFRSGEDVPGIMVSVQSQLSEVEPEPLLRFLAERIGRVLVVVGGLIVVVFVLTRTLTEPVNVILGPNSDEAQRAALNHELGFDKPLWEQFAERLEWESKRDRH